MDSDVGMTGAVCRKFAVLSPYVGVCDDEGDAFITDDEEEEEEEEDIAGSGAGGKPKDSGRRSVDAKVPSLMLDIPRPPADPRPCSPRRSAPCRDDRPASASL